MVSRVTINVCAHSHKYGNEHNTELRIKVGEADFIVVNSRAKAMKELKAGDFDLVIIDGATKHSHAKNETTIPKHSDCVFYRKIGDT